MPPIAICPSPPTLVRLARWATMKPRPTSAECDGAVQRGTDRVRLSPRRRRRRQRSHRGAARRPPRRARGRRAARRRPRRSAASSAGRPAHAGTRRRAPRVMRRVPPSRRRCGHGSRGADGALAHHAAAVHHEEPVGHREQLVELGRAEQHGDAAPCRGADVAVDRLDRADVETARRLRRDEQAQARQRRARAPARPSAGCRPRATANGTSARPRANVERLHAAPRIARASAARSTRPKRCDSARSGSSARLWASDMAGHAALPVPVFGNDADAGGGQHLRRGGCVIGSPPTLEAAFGRPRSCRTARRRARSGRCPRRRRCRRSRRDWTSKSTPSRRRTPSASRRPSRCDAQHHLGPRRAIAGGRSRASTGAPPMRRVALPTCRRQRRRRRGRARSSRAPGDRSPSQARSDRATTRPRRSTVTRCAVRRISASLCVTSTMPQPLRGDTLADLQQALDLLGQQHRGRLVEDQQARLAASGT